MITYSELADFARKNKSNLKTFNRVRALNSFITGVNIEEHEENCKTQNDLYTELDIEPYLKLPYDRLIKFHGLGAKFILDLKTIYELFQKERSK